MYAPEEFSGKLRRKKMPEFERKAEGEVESKMAARGSLPGRQLLSQSARPNMKKNSFRVHRGLIFEQ
jgi:hypothetical protein